MRVGSKTACFTAQLTTQHTTRHGTTTRHQVPFPVIQPPPSDDPGKIHYSGLWNVSNPKKKYH